MALATPPACDARWLDLAVVIALAQSLIVVNGIEAIHYPQYALMAWLLVRCGDGRSSVRGLTATALGALDEIWQWQTLPRAVPGYLDWNDIVLNAVGRGPRRLVIVVRHAAGARGRTRCCRRRWVGGALAVAGLIALAVGARRSSGRSIASRPAAAGSTC